MAFCLGDLLVVWKITKLSHKWSLFERPTYGSWSGDLPMIFGRVTYPCLWKGKKFYKWSLFRWPACGSWSGNLPVVFVWEPACGSWSVNLSMVWKMSRIFHKWSLLRRLACGYYRMCVVSRWTSFWIRNGREWKG
jgi:hypothetical protein